MCLLCLSDVHTHPSIHTTLMLEKEDKFKALPQFSHYQKSSGSGTSSSLSSWNDKQAVRIREALLPGYCKNYLGRDSLHWPSCELQSSPRRRQDPCQVSPAVAGEQAPTGGNSLSLPEDSQQGPKSAGCSIHTQGLAGHSGLRSCCPWLRETKIDRDG